MADRLPSPVTQQPWHARAFGVELRLSFDAPALRRCAIDDREVSDPTELVIVGDREISERWGDDEGAFLGGLADAGGSDLLLDIRETPERGILFKANVHGRYLIEPGQRRVLCAPPDVPPWHWQRMLVGQILPLVSALQGFQVMHASALSVGATAIAISGEPGTGKSTLALELALRGHEILAEDVTALRTEAGRLVAEPGVALVNLRPSDEAERAIAAGGLRELGRSHKIHLDLPRFARPLPLGALFLLEPAPAGAGFVERIPEPTLPDIAQTSFVPYLRRKQDLLGHLEVCATIALTSR